AGRCDTLHLCDYSLESRAIPYDLFKSALVTSLFTRRDCTDTVQRWTLSDLDTTTQISQLLKAARTLSSNTTLSNGFVKTSIAPDLTTSIRSFSSPCAVMKMIGIL